jgi:RNA polymerase sigma-70 factor, ECF subfamily
VAPADRELVEAVRGAQRGDHAAFELIYHRFADALFRYLYGRCGDASLAEELLGELWVRVVEGLAKFRFPDGDPAAAFAAWLYRIARNLVIDHARRASSHGLPLAESLASEQPPPEQRLIARDEQVELRGAFERLTAEQRDVLLLRFVEQRSNAEVAQLTGRSEGAVKVMQHRALESLARLMGFQRRKGERGGMGQ